MSNTRKAHAMSEKSTSKMVVTYPQGIDKRGKTRKSATSLAEATVRRILVILLKWK